MNHWLPIIFLQFISLASATALCAEHDRTCVDVYQAPAVRANFVDELALISALEKNNPPSTEIFQKYGSVLKQLPWARQHTIDLLRIGFKEQIFCNPWPLSIKEIAQKLSRGDFTNALVRELEQANTTPYVMLPGDLMTHMHSAPNVLLSQVRRIKSPFPDEVSIRDPQMQDFTSNFFYYLHPADHKLYIKPNPRKGNVANILKWGVMELHRNGDKLGNRTEWNLFNGDGGPPLSPGRNLVQFSVGSEIVAALDNVGQFYLFKPTEHKTPTQWTTKIGCPIPDKLFLPRDHERWSFSCSVKIKPKERRTIEFMHPDDIVHYYEDSDNKKIDFGFTATVFVLSADGRRIGYWDTGLASHFGRAFTTPHRGNFVADNLSAAGSTIMVIGRNSEGAYEIYTRMFDYEINGACPGEQHTYLKTSAPTPNRVLELLEAQRRLPLPGWQKMADIELVQGDSLSDRISIELTGQGNAARMLKVTGTKNSIDGYYYKMITDNAWQFQPAHEKNNGPSRTPLHEPLQVQKRNDMDYVGRIKASLTTHEQMAHGIKLISLKQFHYFLGADEPATIEITTTNQKTVTLWLHTNDAYSIASQKRGREDLIGNKDGEPKMLVGTLIIPPEYLDAMIKIWSTWLRCSNHFI